MNNFKSMTMNIMLLNYSLSQEFPSNIGKHNATCIIALCSFHSFSLKNSCIKNNFESGYSEHHRENLCETCVSEFYQVKTIRVKRLFGCRFLMHVIRYQHLFPDSTPQLSLNMHSSWVGAFLWCSVFPFRTRIPVF